MVAAHYPRENGRTKSQIYANTPSFDLCGALQRMQTGRMGGSRISQWPSSQRPRERLLTNGADNLSDADLLCILIGSGSGGMSALELAQELLLRFGSLSRVLAATPRELAKVRGIGAAKTALLAAARECCTRALKEKITTGRRLHNSADSERFLLARLRDRRYETFCCLFLDCRNRVLAFEEVFHGTLDSAMVYPREIVRRSMERNAAAVILAHNHPSGVAEPSQADHLITQRIRKALDLIDVRVLDHFIVGHDGCTSLARLGAL